MFDEKIIILIEVCFMFFCRHQHHLKKHQNSIDYICNYQYLPQRLDNFISIGFFD